MERNIILEILKEEAYPDYMIENTVIKLESLHPEIKEAFELWYYKNINPLITIEGYSYDMLLANYRMKPVGAFLTLDWLKREPEKAVKALSRGIKL